MKELGITKGEWRVDFNRIPNGIASLNEQISICTDEWDIACAFVDITDEGDEEKANALLIADAGNTAQKCGLLPSELLQQRDELLKTMKSIYCTTDASDQNSMQHAIYRIGAAIKNTDG